MRCGSLAVIAGAMLWPTVISAASPVEQCVASAFRRKAAVQQTRALHPSVRLKPEATSRLSIASEHRSHELAPVHAQRYVMGTMFEMLAYHAPREEARRAIDAAMDEVVRLDKVMSHYRADSDLAALQRAAARGPVTVDPALFEVIEQSLRFSKLSNGHFDITIGPLLRVWRAAHASGRRPSPDEIAAARRCVGYQHIELLPVNRIRFTSDCLELDLGAIGKGYAVDRAIAILERAGIRHMLVDAGGSSIAARGTPPDSEGWRISIGSGTSSRQITLTSGSLSTSQQQAGPSFGEIIDPAGASPIPAHVSIIVSAPSAAISDALSTTLLLLRRDQGERVFASFPDASAIWIAPSGELIGGFRQDRLRFFDSR